MRTGSLGVWNGREQNQPWFYWYSNSSQNEKIWNVHLLTTLATDSHDQWQYWKVLVHPVSTPTCINLSIFQCIYLTTTGASVRRNEGCFNRRNSLKCKAKVPWTPDFCCALHCSGHRALLTWPSRDHCFLLMYVGNNFITTVLTKPPKWCFSCKRDACKDFFLLEFSNRSTWWRLLWWTPTGRDSQPLPLPCSPWHCRGASFNTMCLFQHISQHQHSQARCREV